MMVRGRRVLAMTRPFTKKRPPRERNAVRRGTTLRHQGSAAYCWAPSCSGGPATATGSARTLSFALRLAALLVLASTGSVWAQPDPQTPQRKPVADPVAALRQSIIDGPHGRMPVQQLVDATLTSQGPVLEKAYLALALRKEEALPAVTEKLRTGLPHEKRAMTKVLRYLGWSEAVPALIEIVTSDTEHSLARIGSLYALGAIGDQSVGPTLIDTLHEPERSPTEKGITIATLARLGFHGAVPSIAPFTAHRNRLVRIFAVRALAELGEQPNAQVLLDALESDDYLVRQEACAALGSVGGGDSVARLEEVVRVDPHSSVREHARVALFMIRMKALPFSKHAAFLQNLLRDKDRKVRSWALSALATGCGEEGREALRRLAEDDSRLGEKSVVHLLVLEGAGPNFRAGY